MPLIAPILDDRSYAELRDELIARIPAYTPEWTDHNESDPGIALLELFAFLGENLLFRFNQIPEATQLAFLRLLDVPLRPGRPARALARFTTENVKGTQLYAGDELKAGKTSFAVEADLVAWPVDCVAVSKKPEPAPDPASEPELAAAVQGTLDALAETNPGLESVAYFRNALLASDGSSPALDFGDAVDGVVWIGLLRDPLKAPAPEPGRPLRLSLGFSPAADFPTMAEVAACPGEGLRSGPALEWRVSAATLTADGRPRYLPLRVTADTTAGFTREGVVGIELPADLASVGVPPAGEALAATGEFPPALDDERAERLWCWLKVWRSDGSRIGATRAIACNAAMARQALRASAELLGNGSGQPGQAFQLAQRPVLLDEPFSLKVQEAGQWTAWARVDNFDASGLDDRHFTVDAEAGIVRFGPRLPQLGERLLAEGYAYGGGAAGNVPAQALAKLGAPVKDGPPPPAPLSRPAADASLKVTNLFPAAGGADAETVAEALTRIPGELRRRERAVTRGDFRELALATPGVAVGRAECLPLFHPPTLAADQPGVVSVVVWPTADPQHPNAPLPDRYLLRRVCEWLDTRRLVTTELYVIPPTYRRLAISLRLKVKGGYGLDAVRNWVELVLRQYLAPLPPYGPEGGGWPLGRAVFDRELMGVVMQVEGVEYTDVLRLAAEGATGFVEAERIELAAWEVPEVAAVTIVDDASDVPPPGDAVPPPAGATPVPVPVLREEC